MSELFDSFSATLQKMSSVGTEKDINLLSTIHLSENDHTNILWQLLQFKRGECFPFLDSFVKNVLGIQDIDTTKLSNDSKTQYQAMPLKTKGSGFIDLLLKIDEKYFIIENKVCGAGDGKWQLLRYYFSFVKLTENNQNVIKENLDEFKELYNKFRKNNRTFVDAKNVYIVYLTKNGEDVDENSIGGLNDSQEFLNVSYFGDDSDKKSIISWLKEDVLPNIPYGESGSLIKSLLLYVDYLDTEMDVSNGFSNKALFRDKDFSSKIEKLQINKLIEEYHNYRVSKADTVEIERAHNQYLRILQASISDKLSNILKKIQPAEWCIKWTPRYIMLYKSEWFEIAQTPSFPLIHWELLKDMDTKKACFDWDFHIEADNLKSKIDTIKEKAVLSEYKHRICSGQIKQLYQMKCTKKTKYILRYDDEDIKEMFREMLNDSKFKDLTDKIMDEVRSLINNENN